jgi:hypothetical protein
MELYTIVWLSELGYQEAREVLQSIDRESVYNVVSIIELEDESFEMIVHKTYFQTLRNKLNKIFPRCMVDSNYDPTEPCLDEVEHLTYTIAKTLKWISFSKRA